MAIPYQTGKFKSTNILATAIWAQSPNLIPANISGYTVSHANNFDIICRSLVGGGEWRMVKSISLILFMLALLAVAMTNYSLSLYLSLALTLPAVLSQPWISSASGYVD